MKTYDSDKTRTTLRQDIGLSCDGRNSTETVDIAPYGSGRVGETRPEFSCQLQ